MTASSTQDSKIEGHFYSAFRNLLLNSLISNALHEEDRWVTCQIL